MVELERLLESDGVGCDKRLFLHAERRCPKFKCIQTYVNGIDFTNNGSTTIKTSRCSRTTQVVPVVRVKVSSGGLAHVFRTFHIRHHIRLR